MQWFKFHADLKDHPKRWRFEEAAGVDHGLHYIALFFSYVCKYHPTGELGQVTTKELARACEWNGDPQRLWDALTAAGFIETIDGACVLHDWALEHDRFIKEAARRKPKGNPRVTHGKPVLEEKRIEEKRTEEKKPKPPIAANAAWQADSDFMQFWSAWPRSCRKGSPVPAYKAWLKNKPPLADVLAFLAWKRKEPIWTNTDQQGKDYIPMPSTFLNGAGWLEQKESGRGRGTGPAAGAATPIDEIF